VNDAQVRVLRRKLTEGKTAEASAAGAGMSVGSTRKWREERYPFHPGARWPAANSCGQDVKPASYDGRVIDAARQMSIPLFAL
jgi:hypothetical protein